MEQMILVLAFHCFAVRNLWAVSALRRWSGLSRLEEILSDLHFGFYWFLHTISSHFFLNLLSWNNLFVILNVLVVLINFDLLFHSRYLHTIQHEIWYVRDIVKYSHSPLSQIVNTTFILYQRFNSTKRNECESWVQSAFKWKVGSCKNKPLWIWARHHNLAHQNWQSIEDFIRKTKGYSFDLAISRYLYFKYHMIDWHLFIILNEILQSGR